VAPTLSALPAFKIGSIASLALRFCLAMLIRMAKGAKNVPLYFV